MSLQIIPFSIGAHGGKIHESPFTDCCRRDSSIHVVVAVVVFTFINHPRLSTQYLLLSQPLCTTTPTLDPADFRGHRLTYLEKVYENKMDPRTHGKGLGWSDIPAYYRLKSSICGDLSFKSAARTTQNAANAQRPKTAGLHIF